ncbi:MAG: four helix bundle protein [Candidatus Acidiferrales bacterium]
MKPEDLRDRTKKVALDVIRFFRSLPKTEECRIMGRQLIRAATSVAANYRAACRARSHAEFVAKIGVVVEEADESAFWLEMLRDSKSAPAAAVAPLLNEANQLVAIFSASRRTARRSLAITKSADHQITR